MPASHDHRRGWQPTGGISRRMASTVRPARAGNERPSPVPRKQRNPDSEAPADRDPTPGRAWTDLVPPTRRIPRKRTGIPPATFDTEPPRGKRPPRTRNTSLASPRSTQRGPSATSPASSTTPGRAPLAASVPASPARRANPAHRAFRQRHRRGGARPPRPGTGTRQMLGPVSTKIWRGLHGFFRLEGQLPTSSGANGRVGR